MPLQEREQEVLTTILESYIAGAAPVGSRTVAKACRLNLSPASIRNIMADLTDQGYLEQPHTSAGRIPTAKAYRFYLDTAMKPQPVPETQKRRIVLDMGAAGVDMGDALKRASKILAGLSLQVGMVIAPRHSEAMWKRIEFALIKPGLVLAVLILQGGLVLQRLIVAGRDVSADDLVKYGNYLNHLFRDLTVSEVRAKLAAEVKKAEKQLGEMYLAALSLAVEAFEAEEAPEIIMDGASNILSQPEFADIAHMRELLSVLEDRSRLLELLDKTLDEFKTVIIIGEESDLSSFNEFGMISSPYGSKEHPLGVVGLLGPLRMDYAKLVPVVNYTASILTKMLDRNF